jgi:hypothetical protein
MTNVTNTDTLKQKDLILNTIDSNKINKVIITSAFFTDSDFLKQILNLNIKIELFVSMRFPTSPLALEKALELGIDVEYLDIDFHSKLILFYKDELINSAIVGSSNFTKKGLSENIETNILINETDKLFELQKHFSNDISPKSTKLDQNKINSFKEIYKKFSDNFKVIKNVEKNYNTLIKLNKITNIDTLKKNIESELNNKIFINTVYGLYLRGKNSPKLDNITLKKDKNNVDSSVYIYIDFNLMNKISWDSNKNLELNLAINDFNLKGELAKSFNITAAYHVRNRYLPKSKLGKTYCGDLLITTFQDLENALEIASNFLKK